MYKQASTTYKKVSDAVFKSFVIKCRLGKLNKVAMNQYRNLRITYPKLQRAANKVYNFELKLNILSLAEMFRVAFMFPIYHIIAYNSCKQYPT